MKNSLLKFSVCVAVLVSVCAFQVLGVSASEEKATYVPISKININKVKGVVKSSAKVKVYRKKTLKGKVVKTYTKGKTIKVTKTKGTVATVKIGKKTYFCSVKNLKFKKAQVGKAHTTIEAYTSVGSDATIYATAGKGTKMVIEGKKGNYYKTVIVVE